MTWIDLLILLLVAGLCGALGQAISGYSRGGCLVSIALGFIGAIIGLWLARLLKLPELFAFDSAALGMWIARKLNLPELFTLPIGDTKFPIVWSIIGSAIFVAIIGLITRRRV